MYEVDRVNKTLTALSPTTLPKLNLSERDDLQEWIAQSPEIVGEEILVIQKELAVSSGARLDLLAIDRSANLIVLELKRDDSGPTVDWQAIRYASYISNFTNDEIIHYFADYLGASVEDAEEAIVGFIEGDIDQLNEKQRIILCAREFHSDVASSVLWLRDYGLDISCLRIQPFVDDDGRLFINAETIIPLPEARDYIVKKERKEQLKKDRSAWSGYYYVNVGEGPHRNWEDSRKYGFLAAGDGRKWSKQIQRLEVGTLIFAYLKGRGYVGFGVVVKDAVPTNDFIVETESKLLTDFPLTAPDALTNRNDPERTEYLVSIRWVKTFSSDDAVKFRGIFAHPSIVARMRTGKSIDFLLDAFEVEDDLGGATK